jgi:hypothetical protein
VLKSELNSADPAQLDNVEHSIESSQLTHGGRRKRTPLVDIQIMSKSQMRQDQIDLLKQVNIGFYSQNRVSIQCLFSNIKM